MPATQRRQRPTPTDVESLRMKLRAQSDFEKESGYCPFYHSWRAELPRLCPGLSCRSLIDAVHSAVNIHGAKAKKSGKAPSEWSPDLDKQELALECCTDKRTVDRDIKYLEISGMAQVRHSIRGTVSIRLMYRDWLNLPDYKPEERQQPGPVSGPAEPKETIELVKKPQRVKAGEYSSPVKVPCPVSSFRFQAGGSVDLAFTAVVKQGEFLICSEAFLEISTDRRPKKQVSNVSNGLGSEQKAKSRHQCLDEPQKSTSYPQRGEHKAKDEAKAKHPRAEELARLFDPLLLRSCQRSLSTDPVVFDEVLNAVGDIPHDFLVKFVIDRAERPISRPKVCVSIVKDATQSWRKLKDLPEGLRIPPQSAHRKSGFFEDVQRVIGERIARGEKPL